MESLRELNQKVQKPRYKEVGNWMVRHILRDAALPITWLLLHTSITANQVTLVSLGVALFGIFLLAFASWGSFLSGVLCLQIWYLLDHVDGQIARYRQTASLTGRFYDFIVHHIVHGALFFSLGTFAFRQTGYFLWIFAGFLTAFGITLFNLFQDAKYKTFFEKLLSLNRIEVLKPAALHSTSDSCEGQFLCPSRRVFSFLHKLCEIHVVMNLLTLGAFIQILLKPSLDLRFICVLLYGAVVPAITVAKLTYWIRGRKIDAEFEATFKSDGTG